MFPFQLFWRLLPFTYLFLFALSGHPNAFFLRVGLLLIATISFYKAREKGLSLAGLELFLLLAYAFVMPAYFVIWLTVPLMDWCWQKGPSKACHWGAIAAVFLITSLGLMALNIEWVLMVRQWFGFVAILWVGTALHDLEMKKNKAQGYYDQLRYSEEALIKANQDLKAYYDTLEEVAALRERTRISREIHDHVGHALATTLIQLQALSVRLSKEGSPSLEQVKLVTELVRKTLSDTRAVVHNMAPSIKGIQMLKTELSTLCQNVQETTGVQVLLTFAKDDYPLLDHQAMAIFRITQEALTNAIKHGQAKHIKVVLSTSPKHILMTIADDGIGAAAVTEHFGLSHMRERVNQLKGSIAFETQPQKGFSIKISLPKEDSLCI